jgi:hypothetical protein
MHKVVAETAPAIVRNETAKSTRDLKRKVDYNSLAEAIQETLGKRKTHSSTDVINRTFSQTAKLTAFDASSSDYFVWKSIAIDGGTAVVGANGDDTGTSGFDQGSVYGKKR